MVLKDKAKEASVRQDMRSWVFESGADDFPATISSLHATLWTRDCVIFTNRCAHSDVYADLSHPSFPPPAWASLISYGIMGIVVWYPPLEYTVIHVVYQCSHSCTNVLAYVAYNTYTSVPILFIKINTLNKLFVCLLSITSVIEYKYKLTNKNTYIFPSWFVFVNHIFYTFVAVFVTTSHSDIQPYFPFLT